MIPKYTDKNLKWVISDLRYSSFCRDMRVLDFPDLIDRRVMEGCWALLCRIKAGNWEYDLEKLAEKGIVERDIVLWNAALQTTGGLYINKLDASGQESNADKYWGKQAEMLAFERRKALNTKSELDFNDFFLSQAKNLFRKVFTQQLQNDQLRLFYGAARRFALVDDEPTVAGGADGNGAVGAESVVNKSPVENDRIDQKTVDNIIGCRSILHS
ncbi:hypothetical protein G7Y89_g6118 [Cudoniella acicularis]|uniref:Uncharacterized protein n=1 Tax=Cudoniella acicularis TaxID=354080 RepID=A0A8H4W5U3_9HELO|nr:hypothetical protein G7Y89_g6118 [Cudoniella acicularis]